MPHQAKHSVIRLVSLHKRFRHSGTRFRTFDFMALSRGVGIFDRLTQGIEPMGRVRLGRWLGSEGNLEVWNQSGNADLQRRKIPSEYLTLDEPRPILGTLLNYLACSSRKTHPTRGRRSQGDEWEGRHTSWTRQPQSQERTHPCRKF